MRSQNVPDAFKSKGGGGILNTNKETGASAWNYSENKFHPSQPGQKFDMRAYNQQALKNAQQKGGGILNTNAETGYDLWHHSGPVKSTNQTNFNYEQFRQEQMAQAKKKGGGILNTNVESEPWSYGGGSGGDQFANLQNRPVNYNPQGNIYASKEYNNPNNNYSYQNQPVQLKQPNQQQNVFQGDDYQNYLNMMKEKGNTGNVGDYTNFSADNKNNQVQKIETSEKEVVENGKRKKITKIKKYMVNGEIKTEIFKTDL